MRALLLFIVLFASPLTAPAVAATGGAEYPGSATLSGGTSPGSTPPRHGPLSGGTTPGNASETPAAGATPTTPSAPVRSATVLPNGKARPPAGAPAAVKRAIRLGNRLQKKPYRFGGGHVQWEDTAYDCSGASSYALRGIGGLNSPLDSTGFMTWGLPGSGKWITTYANPNHMYVVIAGLRLDTGSGGERGPRWRTTPRPPGAFTARHPAGL